MNDKSQNSKTLDSGHRMIFGPTREGCTRVYQELKLGKGNYQWISDSAGSAGKTKLAVELIDSFLNKR